MHLSIINLYVKNNTDNSHNKYENMYYLLYPFVVSYIITYFINKDYSYIQGMKIFIYSHAVAAF